MKLTNYTQMEKNMWIKELRINNFRNYKNEEIKFEKNINIFYGENAQGKTNIIEAIFLCSMGRSFRTNKDKEMILLNESQANIEIEFEKSDRSGKIKIELAGKKNVSINGIKIKKLSELLGNVNIVIFTPDDINILKGGPQNRRRFLDIMISQLKPNYMHNLNLYLKTLEQRNNYLRQIREENKNENMLEIWDEKLSEYAVNIYNYRKEFIDKINKYIGDIYEKTGNYKGLNLRYSSNVFLEYDNEDDLKAKFLKKINDNINKEINYGSSILGVRRDDFSFYLGDKNLINYGSQGQQKLAILSLKLAEIGIFKEVKGENPILLLDDLFGELDIKKRNSVIRYISNDIQTIITTTDVNRIDKKLVSNSKIFKISNGKVEEEKK